MRKILAESFESFKKASPKLLSNEEKNLEEENLQI